MENGRLLGALVENFVFLELKKLSTWSPSAIDLYHYRTQTGNEVDIVLENRAGRIVGVEVKTSESLSSEDWRGLDVLGEEMGEKMVRGIILYPGKEVVAWRKDRLAIPLSALWRESSAGGSC